MSDKFDRELLQRVIYAHPPADPEYAKWVRKQRMERGWTRADLAARIRCDDADLAFLENNLLSADEIDELRRRLDAALRQPIEKDSK